MLANPARRRLRLSRSELEATAVLVDEPRESVSDTKRMLVRALAEAQLMPGGRLTAWADELLTVVARPALVMSAEILTDPAITYSVWATPSLAVLGDPLAGAVAGAVELSAVEPVALPYVLCHLLGLRRQSKVDAEPMRSVSLQEPTPQLVQLLGTAWVGWRVSSSWADRDGVIPPTSVQVIDAYDRGLWTVEGDGAHLTLTPASAREVWDRITDLLPRAEVAA